MGGIADARQNGGTRPKQVIVRCLIIGYHGKSGKEELIMLQTKDRNAGKKAEEIIRSKIGQAPVSAR